MTNQIKNELCLSRKDLLRKRNRLADLWDDSDMVLNNHIEYVIRLLDIAIDVIDLSTGYESQNEVDFSLFVDNLNNLKAGD